ncbi:MAG: alanine--tRNA ligase [Actinomycetaceae bacterium]|nr:alanine--tRNA ligase [Actinomycetaceae bacterium]
MRTAEIRQRWLDYFERNGHEVRDSVSLISPDPSILFTIAGMVPFIPYFIGTEQAPWPRAVSVQKCIRTNDIDEVGKTTRHGTFFQMCGNFSFGDYFKEGASQYAWELLTGSVNDGCYGLDGDKMWVTIWEHDDEAERIWKKVIGLDPTRIQKLPREDIFWDTGQPGPAGPCAEIHYDRGPEKGPEGGPAVDTQGDRYLEVWNLVFDEFLRGEGSGKDYPLLGELDQKAIDTGLGLERLAFLLQGKDNMYEIDQVFPVIEIAQELSGKKYSVGTTSSAPDDVRMRIVADHVRSALMLISDGVRPGNDGAGYVLRRLVRRVVRSMRLLGVFDPVITPLMTASKEVMKASYPELEANWKQIHEVAAAEEESFRRTLDAGTTILDTAVRQAKERASQGESAGDKPEAGEWLSKAIIPGDKAFLLHDTYGFPIDLTIEIAREKGVSVDEEHFKKLMHEQKDRARQDALKKKTGHVDTHVYHDLLNQNGGPVRFLGYTDVEAEATVVAILVDGKSVPLLHPGTHAEVLLDQTPFYAEMGGQLADQGTITALHGASFHVGDVQAPVKGLNMHRGQLIDGELAVGDRVIAALDVTRRYDIAKAHTATHVVHKVLHEKLGEQATQAGSENSPNRMRFDFRHGSAVPQEIMEEIEQRANERTSEDLSVTDEIMDIDKALEKGAMALFGEKYGKEVRVVSIGGDWSLELCAGTHVPATGHIGSIALLSEASIGSGVRRVDALVGQRALKYHQHEHALVSQISTMLGAPADELAQRIENLVTKVKGYEKQVAKLQAQNVLSQVSSFLEKAEEVTGTTYLVQSVGELDSADLLRRLGDDLGQRMSQTKPWVIALFAVVNGRPVVVVKSNKSAQDRGLRAGELVKAAAQAMGGGGGGRPDSAQGGGKDASRIAEALQLIRSTIVGVANS